MLKLITFLFFLGVFLNSIQAQVLDCNRLDGNYVDKRIEFTRPMEIGDVITFNGTIFSQPSSVRSNLITAREIPFISDKTCQILEHLSIIILVHGATRFGAQDFFIWVSLSRFLSNLTFLCSEFLLTTLKFINFS
ncbi:Protein CBG06410 [Caenorhabditis briggsae]|uniref:Protein CBG06410 n=1 Tax=Caenorhabditis briggsae TaxID=6238 RepID=A8X261_CAEBR|nr:Protein CBG06410 [Caenorhabditis briggsae]CAP26721.2 Protein CBG06410 [Caenorhabditis briggsae]